MISITKTVLVAQWLGRCTSRNGQMKRKDGSSNPTGAKCTLSVQVYIQCTPITKCRCSTLMQYTYY